LAPAIAIPREGQLSSFEFRTANSKSGTGQRQASELCYEQGQFAPPTSPVTIDDDLTSHDSDEPDPISRLPTIANPKEVTK
jgi:hypothetical protein